MHVMNGESDLPNVWSRLSFQLIIMTIAVDLSDI